MKNIKGIGLAIIFTTLLSFFNIQNINALSNFEILNLDVTIDVNEDGTYSVTESYLLNFTSPGLGIYRDIPTKYNMKFDDDGKQINTSYYFPVTDIFVEGDEYYVESEMVAERIVIGPDDGPRFTGEKAYTITYKVHTQAFDQRDAKEIFFYNLVSDWEASMYNFSGTVNFYKDVDLDGLVVKGMERGLDFEVPCTINSGSSFTCSSDRKVSFHQGNGITAYVPLDDDFFIRESLSSKYFIAMGLGSLMLILAVVFKFLFGQRLPVIEKVSFTPPKGFNAPMVGAAYSYSGFNTKHIYALLFEWANQGLIQIEETKKSIKFRKLQDIPSDRERFEKILFDKMFKSFDEDVTPKDWQKDNVYETIVSQMNPIMLAVDKKGKQYDSKSKSMGNIIVALACVSFALSMFILFYTVMKLPMRSLIIAVVFSVILMIPALISVSVIRGYNHRNMNKSAIFTAILLAGVVGVLSIVGSYLLTLIFGLRLNSIFMMIITILHTSAIMLGALTQVRTQYGSDLIGEIIGLRSFIKYAKKDELIAMQEINPTLYYDVLPYAYVFDMSDLWLKHFKEIEIPQLQYYTSYNPTFSTYMMMRSLNSSISSVQTSVMPKVQSGSGGGSFSGGGGFSGGGFSGGGGFGGGGGGGR